MEAFIDTMALLFLLKTHWEKNSVCWSKVQSNKAIVYKGKGRKKPPSCMTGRFMRGTEKAHPMASVAEARASIFFKKK